MSNDISVAGAPIVAFILSTAGVPLARWLAVRTGVMAAPSDESRHLKPTPLLGGIAIVGALLLSIAIFGHFRGWIVVGIVGLCAVGLLDDVIVLRPFEKLALQVAVISAATVMLRHYSLLPWPAADVMLEILWLLAVTNAFNFVDGLDGLAAGIGVIASGAVATVALLHHNLPLAIWALSLAGALAGFFMYNFHPASIFMGDAGALPIGLLLGQLTLSAGGVAGNDWPAKYAFPILVMIVPLLDTAIVTATRLATGRPIWRRGLDHSHHRLLLLGLSDRQVVMACCGVALLASACAAAAVMLPVSRVMIMLPFVVVVFSVLGLFMMDLTFDSRAPGITYGFVQGTARLILRLAYQWRLVEAVLDLAVITAAYFGAFLIRLDFGISEYMVPKLVMSLPGVLAATYVAFFTAGIYRGIWRHTGIPDLWRFANAAMLSGVLVIVASAVAPISLSGSIVALFAILLFNFLTVTRLSFQLLRKGIKRLAHPAERVLIVGAGRMGAAALEHLSSGRNGSPTVVGFVDDDRFKQGKFVHGYQVLGSLDDLEQVHGRATFSQILIATDRLEHERSARLQAFAQAHQLTLRVFSLHVNEMSPDGNGFAAEPANRSMSRAKAGEASA